MKKLIENLGRFIAESKAKKVRKHRRRVRAREADKVLAKQIAASMKSRSAEIAKLLPSPWDLASPLQIDKVIVDKFGEVSMAAEIKADYDYFIGVVDDERVETATASFSLAFIPESDGTIVCSVAVGDFYPVGRENGVEIIRAPAGGELIIDATWERGRKPFDPSKDVWPLIKSVMKELKMHMPEYGELDSDFGKSDTERYFGSEAAYWKWKEG
jgi:hypothetical protein